jgi:predicted peptidase
MINHVPRSAARRITRRAGKAASYRVSAHFSQTLRIGSAVLMTAFSSGYTAAQETQNMDGMQNRRMERTLKIDTELDYLLYLPGTNSAPEETWPLMIFLHGAGERGDDLEKVKCHGPPRLIAEGRELPFIIASPQCPEGISWSNPEMILALNALVDELTASHPVDESRIYLTGLSMGGFGTWSLAATYPQRFAAIAPVCGGGNRMEARRLANMPVWVFHGARDKVVPLSMSQEMVDALEKKGSTVKFTVYPEAGHDSWTETYYNEELYTWMLEHRR